MINNKNFDSNLLKIDKKPYKKHWYLLHWTNHNKDIDNYESIHSVNPLCFIIKKVDGYIEVKNRHRYLFFVSVDKNKEALTKCTEFWDDIKSQIKKISEKTCYCNEKCMKIKFDSNDNSPLNKILKLHK